MPFEKPNRSWIRKFADAFAGCWVGILRQKSFLVHFVFAIAVLILGAIFRISTIEWLVVVLCITGVLVAEMLNSSVERLAKAVTDEFNDHVKDSLNIASGAVLIAALGSVVCGLVIFGPRLWNAFTGN